MRLVVEGLACVRGGRRLFQNLHFAVAAGEALAVTGPNGAGKTSLLRVLAGLLRPTAGAVALDGLEAGAATGGAMHLVGHLDAAKSVLTAGENLAFWAALLGGGGGAMGAALTKFGLAPLTDTPARMLSAGQRRRLALARLLVAPRALWLLDEPTTALDAEGQQVFGAVAAAHLAGGGLIVAASHAPLGFAPMRELRLGDRA